MEAQLASEEGLETLLEIGRDPVSFCRKAYPADSEENSSAILGLLVSELLKALYSEVIPVSVKVRIVSLLSEECSALFEGSNSVDVAVVQLMDVFQKHPSGGGSTYRAGILISITNIVLVHDQLERNVDLFKGFAGLLLDVVSHVNANADRHVRSCACDCLHELELAYPGLLLKKLEHLYQMARLENSTAFQSYLLLFVRTMLHAARWAAQQSAREDGGKLLSELLAKRTEPLKPLNVEPGLQLTAFASSTQVPSLLRMTGISKDSEVAVAVKYILDSCLLLTSAAQSALLVTVSSLCDLLTLSSCETIQQLLSDWCQRMVQSFDVQFLGAALYRQQTQTSCCHNVDPELSDGGGCGSDLSRDSLGHRLCSSLCTIIGNPAARAGERLLCCDWLPTVLPLPPATSYAPGSSAVLETGAKVAIGGALRAATPSSFDGWQLQLKKLLTLSKLMQGTAFSGLRSAWLVGTLRSLRKQWWQEVGSRPLDTPSPSSEALFSVLLHFLLDHGESDKELVHDAQQSLYSIVAESPELTPHALWLIKSLRSFKPGSAVPQQLLDDLVDLACSMPSDVLVEGLQHYSAMLREGATGTGLGRLRLLLAKLTDVVRTTRLTADGCWHAGNRLLDVCHSCLCRSDCKAACVELGELLYAVATVHGNVGVRERALLYYAALVNLSADKIRDVLEHKEGISNLMHAGDVSVRIAPPVARVKNIFELEKLDREVRWPACTADLSADASAYGTFVAQGNHPTISLRFRLTLQPNDTTREAFAIVVSMSSSASVLLTPVKDRTINALDLDVCRSEDFNVDLGIARSEPFVLDKLSATFSCSQAVTYSTALMPVQVSIADLACNLPVQTEESFNVLWSNLMQRSLGRTAGGAVLSRTHFEKGKHCAKQLFSDHGQLHAYAMPGPTRNSGDRGSDCDGCISSNDCAPLRAAFFFHPCCHVLTSVSFVDDDANAELLADDFHCLQMVNTLLRACFTGSAPM